MRSIFLVLRHEGKGNETHVEKSVHRVLYVLRLRAAAMKRGGDPHARRPLTSRRGSLARLRLCAAADLLRASPTLFCLIVSKHRPPRAPPELQRSNKKLNFPHN